jgi:hypothetical protein
LEVDGGTRGDVEVRGAGAEPVVVKSGADDGRRWRPAWRRFLDGEGDDGLTNGSSRSSSQWPSGAGSSRNRGGGIERVMEWWWQCRHSGGAVAKGSRRR